MYFIFAFKDNSLNFNKEEKIVPQLQSYIDHFIIRFIEVAGADSDESVALAMISLLRNMQKCVFSILCNILSYLFNTFHKGKDY